MNRFLKLVHFELNRFFKTISCVNWNDDSFPNYWRLLLNHKHYLNRANDLIYKELMPKHEFIEQYGTFSFFDITQIPFGLLDRLRFVLLP